MKTEKIQTVEPSVEPSVTKPVELTAKHTEWLVNQLSKSLLFSKELAVSYEVAYSTFLTQQSEMINNILVSAYDKQGIKELIDVTITYEADHFLLIGNALNTDKLLYIHEMGNVDNNLYLKGTMSNEVRVDYIGSNPTFNANPVQVYLVKSLSIYESIRREFEAHFGYACSFTNKKILDTIVQLSFEQFASAKVKGKRDGVSPEIQILENHCDLLLDFDFRKWIIKDTDGQFIRATNGLIEYIANILKSINKMLSHNEKDKASPKKYLLQGKIVTKTLLKGIIKDTESIEDLNAMLMASIDAYNEAYNINIRLSKALKDLDKETLIEFLEGVSTDGLKELIKARNALTVEPTVEVA